MIRIPDPGPDWRYWASDLVRVLTVELDRLNRVKQDRHAVHLLPELTIETLPLPTPSGQMALITDGVDGTILVRSNGAAWVQMIDGGPLA